MAPKEEQARPAARHRRGHLTSMQSHLVAGIGEFVGTFLFLWLAYAGHLMAMDHAYPPPPSPDFMSSSTVVFIALAYGFSLLVNVWAFYRISGGLFNPAVSLALCLSGQLPWLRAAILIPAQFLACMCAGGLVSAMFPGSSIAVANTILGTGTSTAQGVFIEMFLTAELIFVVLMLAMEKSRDSFIAPVGIGLALFVSMIVGTPYTGASLNPARSFGCAVAGRTFPGYHWIYWIGPVLGALLAAAFYRLVKMLHYEEANEGQDEIGVENGRNGHTRETV